MIGRLLVLATTLLTLFVGLGLAAWLELDSRRGTRVYLPVRDILSDSDLVTFYPADILEQGLILGEQHFVTLDLDSRGVVIGASPADTLSTDTPGLQLRRERSSEQWIIPNSTRLDPDLHARVKYAIIDVSPSGTVYLAGLADAELQPLGRGDSAW